MEIQSSETSQMRFHGKYLNFDLLVWIKVLVFIDFFAVSLVVPILSQYYRDANLDTNHYGLITSMYSICQLLGGVILGFLSDHVSKRQILLLSFIGSSISYLILGLVSKCIPMLFFSRILVGCVKQTMSTSTLIISEWAIKQQTDNDNISSANSSGKSSNTLREKELSQISALASVCFVIGPSIGGILYKINTTLPAVTASVMFILNSLICIVILPNDSILSSTRSSRNLKNSNVKYGSRKESSDNQQTSSTCGVKGLYASFIYYKQILLTDLQIMTERGSTMLLVTGLRLLVGFIQSATSSRNLFNYYQTKFTIETYQLGFLSSYYMSITLVTEIFLVSPILSYLNSYSDSSVITKSDGTSYDNQSSDYSCEITSICLMFMVAVNVVEAMLTNIYVFLLIVMIPCAITSTILTSSLRSMFINTIPSDHLGRRKIMSLYNALSTGLNILSPIYGSQLFTFYEVQEKSHLKGWLTAIHFLFAFFASLTLTRVVFNTMKLYYSKIRMKIDKNKKES